MTDQVAVEIWKDERYPDRGLTVLDPKRPLGGERVQITQAELERYKRVNTEYDNLQRDLEVWSKRETVK